MCAQRVATAGPSQALAHDTPVWLLALPFAPHLLRRCTITTHKRTASRARGSHTPLCASPPLKSTDLGCTFAAADPAALRSPRDSNNALASRHIHRQAPNQQHHTASMSVFDNIILATDSYKVSHYKQYRRHRVRLQLLRARGGKFDEICFFGLQYFIKRYLCSPVVTEDKIAEAADILGNHMGPGHFGEAGWQHILKKHGGMLPISIKAVPESMIVPTKNVLFTMVNTDPECYWLTNYLETLLVEVWFPMTVATNSMTKKDYHVGVPEDGLRAQPGHQLQARLRLPRCLLRRVCRHRRRGPPDQLLPGYRYDGGDVMPQVLLWRRRQELRLYRPATD